MKVSDYIACRLAAEGITHAFLIQGAANNSIIYSIADTPGIEYVCMFHEQCCGFAAEAWSKVKGIPGVAIATSGPGGQNLCTPIANCYYDSVPVLFITGQVNSRFMRKNASMRQLGFQEWPAVECLRPITKYAKLVLDPNDVPHELEKALSSCQKGRPGPCLLDLPIDVQQAEIRADLIKEQQEFAQQTLEGTVGLTPTVSRQIEALVLDLLGAKRPVLLIGGGVRSRGAVEALDALVEALRIPVFPTWNALDVVPSDHPWYGGRIGTYGGPGRNFALQNADLLVAVGCRISGRITGGRPETFARGAKKYVVDIDYGLLHPRNQEVKTEVSVWCDAEVFLREFERQWRMQRIETGVPVWPVWLEQAAMWRNRYDPVRSEHFAQEQIHPYAFARRLSELAPADAVIVTDCGGNVVTMNHAFRTKRGQRYFSNNGNSPMGYSFAAAIGAWFAAPARPVICVIGDGGFCLNIHEVQTLVNYSVKVKTFILDNRCYGITRAYQETHYGGRLEACVPEKGYGPPDFLDVVRAFGSEGRRVATFELRRTDHLERIIKDVLAHDGPAVCVVACPGFHQYEPRLLGWATPVEDLDPKLPREEFRANMLGVEPLPGWETGEYK